MEFTFENLNTASIGLSKAILKHGEHRKTRGFDCIEFVEPVLIHITNPLDRYINIKARKHHKVLPFAESLALASGVNDMGLYAGYVPSMINYSDDGVFQRAGYGPRIRAYSGLKHDYTISDPKLRRIYSGFSTVVDQLKFVVDTLKNDLYSRQAVITIADPAKDCFEFGDEKLITTKDMPCSRSLQFMVVKGKLDCILYIRSNDILFGLQAVNVFNFTFMQEYVASILDIPVGIYHHFAANLHFYEDKLPMIENIAACDPLDYKSKFPKWRYVEKIHNIKHFDYEIDLLYAYENALRNGIAVEDYFYIENPICLFADWAKVFKYYWTKEKQKFCNPYLNLLFNGGNN